MADGRNACNAQLLLPAVLDQTPEDKLDMLNMSWHECYQASILQCETMDSYATEGKQDVQFPQLRHLKVPRVPRPHLLRESVDFAILLN
eukprot:CAMPEP_0169122594 /NCGR_PEP_ID=MMETSP1015-20121227/33314_1 /TAXON_ID=342587 /ORGANISM="Karlodinium micrum, Strain CCMP2283" /LENGTH=88 /DNA_ID=CAMNT_0009185833 /DNA_START=271 /DNA_END=537 /DNA_ORIENTATION=+